VAIGIDQLEPLSWAVLPAGARVWMYVPNGRPPLPSRKSAAGSPSRCGGSKLTPSSPAGIRCSDGGVFFGGSEEASNGSIIGSGGGGGSCGAAASRTEAAAVLPGVGLRSASFRCPILQSYIDVCVLGCLEHSEAFAEEFLRTTRGWDGDEPNPVSVPIAAPQPPTPTRRVSSSRVVA